MSVNMFGFYRIHLIRLLVHLIIHDLLLTKFLETVF